MLVQYVLWPPGFLLLLISLEEDNQRQALGLAVSIADKCAKGVSCVLIFHPTTALGHAHLSKARAMSAIPMDVILFRRSQCVEPEPEALWGSHILVGRVQLVESRSAKSKSNVLPRHLGNSAPILQELKQFVCITRQRPQITRSEPLAYKRC